MKEKEKAEGINVGRKICDKRTYRRKKSGIILDMIGYLRFEQEEADLLACSTQ